MLLPHWLYIHPPTTAAQDIMLTDISLTTLLIQLARRGVIKHQGIEAEYQAITYFFTFDSKALRPNLGRQAVVDHL